MFIKVVSFLLICSAGYATEIIPDARKIAIETPAFKKRESVKLRLANGLEAYVISDPAADRSAAGLCVGVGSWQDPTDVPGMAHFVEHLLFLGTATYPEESGFDRFVGDHNGETNAHTAETETCYFFAVDNSAFPESLARFSRFFKEPLFNPSGVAREISAIDQEFSMARQRDQTRQWLMFKELSNPAHPFHHFNYGNRDTLEKVPRERVIEWYHDHYSANLMHLMVYSSLPLSQLQQLVVEQFSAISNQNKQLFYAEAPMLDDQLRGSVSWLNPLKQERSLTLMWELPNEFGVTRLDQADSIISYIFGHEGSRSLLAQLKREKLAEGIETGGEKMGNDHLLFIIKIKLTKAGLAAKDTVIERVFQEIETLRRKGIPRTLFTEIQQVQRINYQYQTRDKAYEMVQKYTPMMIEEPLSTFPEQQKVIATFDAEKAQRFLAALTPQNVHVGIIAPTADQSSQPMDRSEHWTGSPYSISRLTAQQIAQWSKATPHPDIDLPMPNSFIPRQLKAAQNELKAEQPVSYPIPKVIADEPFGKVYYAPDNQFGVPEVAWILRILTPEIDSGSAEKTVIADLYVKSVTEALKDIAYDAQMAGLTLQIERETFGIRVALNGYSENASLLLRQVLERMKSVRPDLATFRIFKEALLMQYTNFCQEPALLQALYTLRDVLMRQHVTEAEKAKALRSVDHRSFTEAVNRLFAKHYTQAMLYGNLTAADATAVWQMVRQTMAGEPYPADQHQHLEVIQLPADGQPIQLEVKSKAASNAVLLAIEDGPFSFKNYAIQKILAQAMKAPFFSTLRTEQQTAYALSNWEQELERHLFTLFAAASHSHSVRDLLARFELMIETYAQQLGHEELPEKAFEALREAVALSTEQLPESTQEMGRQLAVFAFDNDGDFRWNSQIAQAMRSLRFTEFVNGARAILGKHNNKRVAILQKGNVENGIILEYQKSKGIKSLRQTLPYLPRS